MTGDASIRLTNPAKTNARFFSLVFNVLPRLCVRSLFLASIVPSFKPLQNGSVTFVTFALMGSSIRCTRGCTEADPGTSVVA